MSPIVMVQRFIDAWNRDDLEAVFAALSADIVYHNLPMAPLRGIAAVRAFFAQAGPMTGNSWEVLNIAAHGSVVLTERIDRFRHQGKSVTLPVMGAFEIEDGKIKAWRDYFDLETYVKQLQ